MEALDGDDDEAMSGGHIIDAPMELFDRCSRQQAGMSPVPPARGHQVDGSDAVRACQTSRRDDPRCGSGQPRPDDEDDDLPAAAVAGALRTSSRAASSRPANGRARLSTML